MFRSAKWKSEKNRIKAAFKLHFHATQVLQCEVDALVLSIVPGDIGRPTKRLEKATIRDGNCRWENPVYETVKFIQEPKTGKFSDKIYHFSLSTGLQENIDQREEDECEDAKLKFDDMSSRNQSSNGDTDESNRSYFSEDVSAKAIISRTSSLSDMTFSSSDDSSGLDTPREIGLRKTNIRHTTNQFVPGMSQAAEPQSPAVNGSPSMPDVHQRSQWNWSANSELQLRIGDSTNGSHTCVWKKLSI